jgi:hypothetical protein
MLLLVAVAVGAALPAVPDKLALLDVACLAALPLLATTLLRDRRLGVLVLVCAAWMVGQVISDLWNGGVPRPSQGLVAAVTVLVVTTAFIRLSGDDPVRIRLLVAAAAVGVAAGGVLFSGAPAWSAAELWKYAVGAPVSVAVLAVCDVRWRAGSRRPALVALAILFAVNVLLDFRSLALFTLLTAVLFGTAKDRSTPPSRFLAALRSIALSVLVAGGFLGAAQAGWLGERTTDQVRQDSANVYELAVNLRPEMLQSIYLISLRPVVGYGSQPRLDSVTFAGSLRFVAEHGVHVDINLKHGWQRSVSPGVVQHSMLFGTTVMAGILAVPFWLFLWRVGLRAATEAIRLRSSPMLLFWTLVVLWDSLFSPLTGLYHLLLAGYLALVLTDSTAGTRRSAVVLTDSTTGTRRSAVAASAAAMPVPSLDAGREPRPAGRS